MTALRRMDARGRHHEGGGRGGLLTSQDEYVATSLSRSHGLIDVSPHAPVGSTPQDTARMPRTCGRTAT